MVKEWDFEIEKKIKINLKKKNQISNFVIMLYGHWVKKSENFNKGIGKVHMF